MKKKIFYWSPCLNPVGTVKSTLNSAVSMSVYGDSMYDVALINTCGEWDSHSEYLEKQGVEIINLSWKFYRYLPKVGYLQSRFSYIVIFIFCFVPLIRLLFNKKPDFLIAHLITSLPLTVMNLFRFNTRFILRISGMPKLNFFRKNFWKLISNKVYLVTCPTLELKKKLFKNKIFDENYLHFLPDAIIDIKKFINESKINWSLQGDNKDKRIIFAAGRLTKQKNFLYLVDEFAAFVKENSNFLLIILGEGEQRKSIEKKIVEKKIENSVILEGHVHNVYKYFIKGEIFVLSSLWEEVGFVMVEAALSNLFIISSDCPNGPTEFLNYGKNGNLFKNNKSGDLTNSLKDYNKLKTYKTHKLQAKKELIKYTKFRHFLELKKLLK